MNIEKATESIVEKTVSEPLMKHIFCPCGSSQKFEECHGDVKNVFLPTEQVKFPEFKSFPKISRYRKEIIITEKVDGSNAQIYFDADGHMWVGSRNRWLSSAHDNYGFFAWCKENEQELRKLGLGHHFGEWYGAGIQRRYGLTEKKLALFNTSRWTPETVPSCCQLVPVLYKGVNENGAIEAALDTLRSNGSVMVPGFKNPEGIVIYHVASGTLYKITLEDDDKPKGKVNDS